MAVKGERMWLNVVWLERKPMICMSVAGILNVVEGKQRQVAGGATPHQHLSPPTPHSLTLFPPLHSLPIYYDKTFN